MTALKLQFSGTTEYTLESKVLGEHGLKFAWNYIAAKSNVRSTVPGDAVISTIGGSRSPGRSTARTIPSCRTASAGRTTCIRRSSVTADRSACRTGIARPAT